MNRRLTRKGLKRREEILSVAVELIGEGGLSNATIANIATRLGRVDSYLYLYFSGIDDIVFQTIKRTNARYFAAIHARMQAACTAEEKLSAFIEANFSDETYSPANRMAWLTSWSLVPHNSELVRLSVVLQRFHARRLAKAFADLGLDGKTEARQIWFIIDGLWLWGAKGGEHVTAQQALDSVHCYVEKVVGRTLR